MTALLRRIPMVLLILTMGFTSSAALADGYYYKGRTIVDKLVATDGAQALVAAVLLVDEAAAAGIAGLLSDKYSRFTVLAPSNAAFEKLLGLDAGTLNGLTIEQIKDALPDILKGLGLDADAVVGILVKHVASGKATANKLLKKGSITVLAKDSTFPVGIGASGMTVNYETTVIKADVWASNGIIHFIDTVIVDADPK